MPYDPPNQTAWRTGPVLGYAGYKVADTVKTHELWGGGSYIFTNVDPSIQATRAFEVPVTPGVRLHHLLTVQLLAGLIDHVINDTGDVTPGPVAAPSLVMHFPADGPTTPTHHNAHPPRRRRQRLLPTTTTPTTPTTTHHSHRPTPRRHHPTTPTTPPAGGRPGQSARDHHHQQCHADLVRITDDDLRHPARRERGEDRQRPGHHLHRRGVEPEHARTSIRSVDRAAPPARSP